MKDIKVFISSTFNDLVAERNKIMLAFREAERYAIKKYINLKTIDFRWGLPDGTHVMKNCLESINISKPYFLCILGDNYGSQPRWEDYEKERGYLTEYNQFIEDNVFKSKPENNLSYTAMEVCFALSQGYGKDNVRFLHLAYKNEANSRQQELIKYINEKGYSPVECNTPDELVKEASQFLTSIIDKNSIIVVDDEEDNNARKYIFGGFNGINTQHGQLSLYRKSQEYLLNSKLLDSFSREQENAIDAFVESESTICCIEGEDGVGKSTLVARWLDNRIKNNDSDKIIIYHFCQGGYTDDIFEHLYLELAEINNHPLEDYYAELFGTNEHFPDSFLIFKEAFKQLKSDKQILFVLDGLEHTFEAFFSCFFDLFSETGLNIKLILTTGTSRIDPYDCEILQLPCLKADEAKYIITNYLKAHYKTDDVSNKVAEVLVLNPILHNPKLLLSVLYDIRAFANHNNINDKVTGYQKAKDASAVYAIIVSNWRNIIPYIDDNNILAWIAYSHFGLAEEDIKNVAGFIGDKAYLWHQLFSFIEPYIEWNGDRIQFSNKWLKETIVKDNLNKEKEIKNLMITYFQDDSISIEKQFDELPLLLKEMNRYDELLAYILDYSVFQYANEKDNKRRLLINLWSNFDLTYYSRYLDTRHDDINEKDYVSFLHQVSQFLYLYGIDMFPFEEHCDIEDLYRLFGERLNFEHDVNANKDIDDPVHEAEAYKVKAVAYIDSFKFEEARNLLDKGIALLRPIVKEKSKMYDTTKTLHNTPELFQGIDKTFKSLIESNFRTDLLRVLNPYIDLLGEMLNTSPGLKKANKVYEEVLGWIDTLDHVKDDSRDTLLLRSQIEYAYGMNLYGSKKYLDAFIRFDAAFTLKYEYLLKEERFHRKDTHQEVMLMSIYKMIESCQVMAGNGYLYNNQALYVEAVEKYGHEHLDIFHYCNCLYNYAAFFYNQTVGNENNNIIPLLEKAFIYYDKVVSLTERNNLHELFIRASFFKMMCLANMDKDEDISAICDSILQREKSLDEDTKSEAFMNQILTICHSMDVE